VLFWPFYASEHYIFTYVAYFHLVYLCLLAVCAPKLNATKVIIIIFGVCKDCRNIVACKIYGKPSDISWLTDWWLCCRCWHAGVITVWISRWRQH